jgi:ABC-2 type transport system permease protein
MKALLRLTSTEIKLFFREFQAVFWTFFYPILMLYIFGAIFKNATVMGMGFTDAFLPALIGINLTSITFFTIGAGLTMYRERQILRRYHASPLHPAIVLGAHTLHGLLILLLSGAVILIAGDLFFSVHIPVSMTLVHFVAGLVLSVLSFFAFGFAVSGLAPNSRAAYAMASLLMNVMVFLSGATIPYEVLPKALQYVAKALPLHYVVDLLQHTWKGDPITANMTDVYVLIGVFLLGSIVAARTFRWE